MAHAVHGDPHGTHEHPAHLAHHFDTPEQQISSGKLGMWLFLATEVLLFGGLFCAYAIYRATHPEIFEAGHVYLDKRLGAINTCVLILSSVTMALGVYFAQTSNRKALVICLALTLAGGFGFMGIKYVEYKAKWEHGLLPGKFYHPSHAAETGAHAEAVPAPAAAPHGVDDSATAAGSPSNEPQAPGAAQEPAPAAAASAPSAEHGAAPAHGAGTESAAVHAAEPTALAPPDVDQFASRAGLKLPSADHSTVPLAPAGPAGIVLPALGAEDAALHVAPDEVHKVNVFFAIYFCMTGLHGLHVVAGMAVLAWLLVRAVRGEFSAAYFAPVDLGGLYWHLVDLIWIFLFPLLYLIH